MTTINDKKIQRTEQLAISNEKLPPKADSGEEKLNAEHILSSLKEKALLFEHLKSKAPTNSEIEEIKAELEKTIKKLEGLNV